ncbi:hypothetical protein [Pseudomonas aeruginosa]|uniref:hypothetical protein n=1 Tax=Pseudomonas aeruginosa TaxID=287 RepID=UPI003A4DE674
MSDLWHAALKTLGAGAVSALVLKESYAIILNPALLEGVLPWQRFALLALIVFLVFIFCYLLLGYGLKLMRKRDQKQQTSIKIENSKIKGDVVGGNKTSYRERP